MLILYLENGQNQEICFPLPEKLHFYWIKNLFSGVGMNIQMVFFCSLLIFSISAKASQPDSQLFYRTIEQRLGVMRHVAAYKWQRNIPIEDTQREERVLESGLKVAERFGFFPDTVESFLRLQIEAAKEIQQYWHAQWEGRITRDQLTNVPDLVSELRPQLLDFNEQMLSSLSNFRGPHDRSSYLKVVQAEGLSLEMRNDIYKSILEIRFYSDRLQQIQSLGKLRVGTTGDYLPFTYKKNGDSDIDGTDIRLAKSLAEHLGVELVFFMTSWPTLMQDLSDGFFDIGMGGISITSDRADLAYFSIPYFEGGKTPIVRCEDMDRFLSLADIDRIGTRLIVNPGGTNQRFLANNILHAQVILHDDNRTIFQEIIDGKADVMITDRIEVDLQTSLHIELCSPLGNNLNQQQKAYLLPKDGVWKALVDKWLMNELAVGRPQKLMDYYLYNSK